MRHRYKYRQLSRKPKHRLSLIRTMCTQLIEHERIYTTLAKAKELRAPMEKLIHKAKRLEKEDHLYLYKNLRTSEAIKKIKEEIAPRFKKLPAGYTRVVSVGSRKVDKAHIGMIEIMGNLYQEGQRDEIEKDLEKHNLDTFWQWEAKVCEQEVDYYEGLLRDLKNTIDIEIADELSHANLEDFDSNIPRKLMTAE